MQAQMPYLILQFHSFIPLSSQICLQLVEKIQQKKVLGLLAFSTFVRELVQFFHYFIVVQALIRHQRIRTRQTGSHHGMKNFHHCLLPLFNLFHQACIEVWAELKSNDTPFLKVVTHLTSHLFPYRTFINSLRGSQAFL